MSCLLRNRWLQVDSSKVCPVSSLTICQVCHGPWCKLKSRGRDGSASRAVTAPWRLKQKDQGPHLQRGCTTDLTEIKKKKIAPLVPIFFQKTCPGSFAELSLTHRSLVQYSEDRCAHEDNMENRIYEELWILISVPWFNTTFKVRLCSCWKIKQQEIPFSSLIQMQLTLVQLQYDVPLQLGMAHYRPVLMEANVSWLIS